MINKYYLILAALGASTLSACGPELGSVALPSDADGIVHGRSASEDPLSASVVALVATKGDRQALCTGTILDAATVLTAAHCVDGEPSSLTVAFGKNVRALDPDHKRSAIAVAQHPRWKERRPTERGDLALVRFTGGLPKGFKAVRLAPSATVVHDGDPVTMIGYGVTNGVRHSGSGQLRETKTSVIGQKSPSEIVTDGHKSGVCFGDSGGPGFDERGAQWGIASSVTSQACNDASVHTEIMPYRDWINETRARLPKAAGRAQ